MVAQGYESEIGPIEDDAIEKELAVATQEGYILYKIAREFGGGTYNGDVNIHDLKRYFNEKRGLSLLGFIGIQQIIIGGQLILLEMMKRN